MGALKNFTRLALCVEALCVAVCHPQALSSPHAPQLSPIFIAGTHGYVCFRIPSAVQAPSGALLVFAEARAVCDDNNPLNDVVYSRSEDNGTSWSAPIVVFPGFGHFDFRNPTAVYSSTGTLVLQFINATGTQAPWTNLQMASHDEGVTWSAPSDPVLGIADSYIPTNGLLLSARSPSPGRLLMCGTNYFNLPAPARPLVGARVWYSDDASGAPGSWTSPPTSFTANMSECTMAELGNGSVLINFRASHINRCLCRSQARSDDGGVTWSPLAYVPDLIEPVCSAGLLEVSTGLLFSNPASRTSRVNMTVRRSRDGGLTWPDATLISSGGSAYSVLVPVGSSGAAGVVFETMDAAGYSGIVFAPLPPF